MSATPLSSDRIAAAALRIADRDGLDAVSMRRLAAELEVSAMTGYRYVSGKDEILELIVDAVRAEMLLESPGDDWRTVLRDSALRFRAAVLRHPWMADVPGRVLFAPTPAYLALNEQQFAALAASGIPIDRAATIAAAVTAYARATTHDEIARARASEARDANRERLRKLLAGGAYPTFARYVAEDAKQDDARTRFVFGLDCLLDGIEGTIRGAGLH